MMLNLSKFGSLNKMKGVDFIGRLSNYKSYVGAAMRDSMVMYSRVMLTGPSTDVLALDDSKNGHYGVNYASADYLGLAQHPDVIKAANIAIQKYGVSSGNIPSGLGSHEYLSP